MGGGAEDWVDSLPLLPAGTPLFEALPARAIVLDALAPAVGDGVITMTDRDRTGVLVIRSGRISDAVSFDGARSAGDLALLAMSGWDAAVVSASHLTETAMSILGALITGERCYEDLRLEWTRWSQLLDDLRERGRTYVVEVRTAAGRGVTIVHDGQQVATYTDAHPGLGEPSLVAALADAGAGSVRVTMGSETSERMSAVRNPVAPRAPDGTRECARAIGAPGQAGGVTATEPPIGQGRPAESDGQTTDNESAALTFGSPAPAPAGAYDPNEGNATLTALFGDALDHRPFTPLVVVDPPNTPATTSVGSLLPELRFLAQQRLHRSAGPVEDVVEAAADGGESVAWLAERVRVMTIRGFVTSTFEQLAHDMLALTRT